MRIVDANVLLYAVNTDAIHHAASKRWLDRAVGGADSVGFAWIALLAFVRLATKDGLFAHPLSIDEAMRQVDEWITAPGARVVHAGHAHAELLLRMLRGAGHGANLVDDAHLAALAREQRAEIVSYDRDFARFPEVRSATPEQLLAARP